MPSLVKLPLIFVILNLIFLVPSARATTDPQSATASATATVPVFSQPGPNQPPTAPILISPNDGAITSDTTPEFVWRRSTDPDDNTISYTFLLDGVATFLGISNTANSGTYLFGSRVDENNINLIPTIELSEGYHVWKVIAYDLAGNETASTQWGFTIDTTAPFIQVIDVDTYHLPAITSDSIFDIDGPKDVQFTIGTEPYATITLRIHGDDFDYIEPYPTDNTGTVTPYIHLEPGIYNVDISSFDHAGLTAVVPTFRLNIKKSVVTITLPLIPNLIPSTPKLSFTPPYIPSLPATVAKLSTRGYLPIIYTLMLAIAIIGLIIILWKRRPNLYLVDEHNKPLKQAKVYHSKPTTKRDFTQVLLTKHEPTLYDLKPSHRGLLHIPKLTTYSTLTVTTDNTTLILSISRRKRIYTYIV